MNIPFKNEDRMANSELEKQFINACFVGTIEEVKKCLDEGVNINVNIPPVRDGEDSYPLLVSVYHCNRVDILDLLFERGIDIDHRSLWGATTLVIMCELQKYNYARDLIIRGANVNASNKDGYTALHRVADHTYLRIEGYISEDIEFFKELIDWGADPYNLYKDYYNRGSNDINKTAIDLLYNSEYKEEIEDYINRGKNIKGAGKK